ncbi:MAG: tRNA pseudouridine(38-40) synthase TruA [Gammaproteobacteria bacterium]|nr:tRNA pseudouridine(38-40) synthase TruA [Gammaproteobacteria bacterium]
MPRIALGIEYDGSAYCGWQLQDHSPSVQADLEKALAVIANEPIRVHCAGRTDTGVHALEQVVHFDTSAQRAPFNWVQGTNTKMPPTVNVVWATEVNEAFHARFKAYARRYQYVILNSEMRSALLAKRANWYRYPLNAELMHEAAQALVGEHDFSSFRASSCQAAHARRLVSKVSVSRVGDYVIIDLVANAFLHHMVRNIAGTLMKVGREEEPVSWVAEVLNTQDRTLAGVTAEPEGLYFVNAFYPEEFVLPYSGKEVSQLLLPVNAV